MDEKIQNYIMLGGIVFIIVLITIVVFLIKPASVGSAVANELEESGKSASDIISHLEFIKSELSVSNKNLESCQKLNDKYLNELTSEKNQTFNCVEEQRRLQSEFDRLTQGYENNISQVITENQEKMTSTELELNNLKIEFNNLKEEYNNIVQNSANNICCKQKVDSPSIDSYRLSNDKIICSVGEEAKIVC